jgi:type I restriction enzyme S subunit
VSFSRHSLYRSSGADWLGDIPAHWSVGRMRSIFEIKKRIALTLGLDVFSITQSGIRIKDIESNEGQLSSDYSKYQLVEAGDFAMNPMDLLTGGVDIARSRGVTSPDYRVVTLRDHDRYFGPYLLYVLQTCYRRHIFYGYGQGSSHLGRWRLPTDQFLDFVLPTPPRDEQEAVSAFLDRETAAIDALIADQRRLIELLTEKRQAVISHAVTRGLNPGAAMKPSGAEWLGPIPAHWALPPLYARYEQALGKMLDQSKDTGEYPTPYLRNIDVRWDYINAENLPVMDIKPDERSRFMVCKGDLLTVEGRELGRAAIWIGDDGTVAFQKALHRLRPLNRSEHPRYLFYTLMFANGTNVFLANQSPNEIPHLTGEQLRRYRFPKPPYDEQVAIAQFLDREARRFDALILEAQRAVALLHERRAALISAAVTGQIDVRGHAAVEVA